MKRIISGWAPPAWYVVLASILVLAQPIRAQTVFQPPYPQGKKELASPAVKGVGGTTVEQATANTLNGHLTFYTEGKVTLTKPLTFGVAASGAKPYLAGCFIAQATRVHTFVFDYAYAFTTHLEGSLKVRTERKSSMAFVQAIGEVYGGNVLVGDGFNRLFQNWALFLTTDTPTVGQGRLVVKAGLVKNQVYSWKFIFGGTVSADAANQRTPLICTCYCLADPGIGVGGGPSKGGVPGPNGLVLQKVTITPPVLVTTCEMPVTPATPPGGLGSTPEEHRIPGKLYGSNRRVSD